MKLLNFSAALLATSFFLYSCNDGNKTVTSETTKDSLAMTTPGIGDTSTTGKKTNPSSATSPEQEFINYAVPKNTKEIIWITAGTMKGDKEIKKHSVMMLKDHNKLAMEIKTWMGNHTNIMMPALDTANEVNINNKMGNEWNKAWVEKMIADHVEILEKLKSAKTSVADADLNKIISNTIPVVESHLSMSKMMATAKK